MRRGTMTSRRSTNRRPEGRGRNLAVYGNVEGTGTPLAPGLTTAMVNICDADRLPGTHAGVATGTGVVNLVTVSITGYIYNSIVTYVAPATLNFNDISMTMRSDL